MRVAPVGSGAAWPHPMVRLAGTTLLLAFLAATPVHAGEHVTRLHSPAKVKGFIGGESHDSYVIRARKGQRLTVEIWWRMEHDKELGDNHAEFWVGELPDFNGDAAKFGTASKNGKIWSGTVPKTRDYYIYVVAHPTANYTLKVTLGRPS